MSDDTVVRLVVVGAVALVAVAAGRAWTHFGRPRHSPVDLRGLDLAPGLVVFTATTCGNCRRALEMAAATAAPVREVTYELEAASFRRAGVEKVPLTVAVARDGSVVGQVAGVPPVGVLRRLVRRAGF